MARLHGRVDVPVAPGPPTADRPDRPLSVPVVDRQEDGRVYDASIARAALVGALIGALVCGWLGYGLAQGSLAVTGLGQWAASGTALAAATGAGVGVAFGGLAGALVALYRIPVRASDSTKRSSGQD